MVLETTPSSRRRSPSYSQAVKQRFAEHGANGGRAAAAALSPTKADGGGPDSPGGAITLAGSTEGVSTQGTWLLDVSAWLVINSMRAERVQFDQLCGQSLQNIWRQNAWNELLDGHQHFKVANEMAMRWQ